MRAFIYSYQSSVSKVFSLLLLSVFSFVLISNSIHFTNDLTTSDYTIEVIDLDDDSDSEESFGLENNYFFSEISTLITHAPLTTDKFSGHFTVFSLWKSRDKEVFSPPPEC